MSLWAWGGDSGLRGPPGAPRLPQSDLPFPSPEVRGPSHSTSAQSRPRAAAHSAGAPASSRGSRGACVLHLPQGKLGLGPGWAGEGRRPIRPQGGRKREIAVLFPSPPSLWGCLGLAMSLDSRSLLLFRKPLLHDTLPLSLVTTYVSSSQLQEYMYQLGILALKL